MAQQTAATTASGTWNRAAQRVRALAESIGYPLDERELVLLDVSDLHAVENRLDMARTRHAVGLRTDHRGAQVRTPTIMEGLL